MPEPLPPQTIVKNKVCLREIIFVQCRCFTFHSRSFADNLTSIDLSDLLDKVKSLRDLGRNHW